MQAIEKSELEKESTSTVDRSVATGSPARSRKQKMNISIIILSLALVAISIFASASVLKHAAPKEVAEKPVLTVAVAPANTVEMNKELEVTGTIRAWDLLPVGAEVGGLRIESVRAEEGDFVSAGQVLATLNDDLLQANLIRELARLKGARASLSKARQPNRPEDISALKAVEHQMQSQISAEKAQVTRALASLENARGHARRFATLQAEGAVSKQDLDDKIAAERIAQADYEAARQKLNSAEYSLTQAKERFNMAHRGGRLEDIEIEAADLAEIQANIQNLRAQIAQTIIKAPTDGLITKREAYLGDISSPGKALFTMVRDNKLELRAEVPDSDLKNITVGQPVIISSTAIDGASIEGKIRELSPTVDGDTRLATIRVDLPSDKRLRPGMFVHGRVELGSREVLAVPASALIDGENSKVVFVLSKDHALAKTVHTGTRTNEYVEIISGLEKGDKAIVSGAGFLASGDLVRVEDALDNRLRNGEGGN